MGPHSLGQKVKYHYISITKSISKIFKPNIVCLLVNERYKTYQTGFPFCHLGHAPGAELGGTVGGGEGVNFPLSPKFNQIWSLNYLHEWHMQRHNFLGPHPLGPWGGAKRSNIIKSQLQSQFQRFLNQTLCAFSQNERYDTYQTGFSFSPLVHAPGFGTWGAWGQNLVF